MVYKAVALAMVNKDSVCGPSCKAACSCFNDISVSLVVARSKTKRRVGKSGSITLRAEGIQVMRGSGRHAKANMARKHEMGSETYDKTVAERIDRCRHRLANQSCAYDGGKEDCYVERGRRQQRGLCSWLMSRRFGFSEAERCQGVAAVARRSIFGVLVPVPSDRDHCS